MYFSLVQLIWQSFVIYWLAIHCSIHTHLLHHTWMVVIGIVHINNIHAQWVTLYNLLFMEMWFSDCMESWHMWFSDCRIMTYVVQWLYGIMTYVVQWLYGIMTFSVLSQSRSKIPIEWLKVEHGKAFQFHWSMPYFNSYIERNTNAL